MVTVMSCAGPRSGQVWRCDKVRKDRWVPPPALPYCGPDLSVATQLDFATVCLDDVESNTVTCNINGDGPDYGEEGAVRFRGIAPGIDLKVTDRATNLPDTPAHAWTRAGNDGTCSGQLGRFTLQTDDRKYLTFHFMESETDNPVVVASTQITFADIERVGNTYQRVYVYGASSYILHKDTRLEVTHNAARGRHRAATKPQFTSTVSRAL